MVGKGISPDNIVLAFIKKIIAVNFDYKHVLSKIVFLMDMQEMPSSANLHKNLKIARAQSKLHKGGKFDVKFMWRLKFLGYKIIDQPTTLNN